MDNVLIAELKAVRSTADDHVAQLLGYLKSARIEHGLLINFGSYKFQMRKYALSQDHTSRLRNSLGCFLFNFFALFAFFRG